MNGNNTFLTLSEVAGLLRISPNYAKTQWPKWMRSGVVPLRKDGTGRLLFRRSQIMQMVDTWKVRQ